MKKVSLFIILLIPVILLSYSWQVNHDGNGDFATIQAAIDNVALASGDSIIVWSCVDSIEYYPECLYIERDISFYLCSQQDSGTYLRENTYICGDGNTDIIKFERDYIDSAHIYIIGFTITHLDEVNGRGINISGGDSLTTSKIEISECDIVNNICLQHGSGIYCHTVSNINQPLGEISIIECSITNNNTDQDGAGIFFDKTSDKILIEDCSIKNNSISDTLNYSGGGIYLKNSSSGNPQKVTINESIIDDNFGGASGGGILANTNLGSIYIANSFIKNNEAVSGGGIKFINSGTDESTGIQINNCEISNNMANLVNPAVLRSQSGGGICVYTSNLSIEETLIDSNYAHSDGGGILLYSKGEYDGCKVEITDSDITNNIAEGFYSIDPAGGGMISSNSKEIICDNVQISNNMHTNGKGGGIAFLGNGTNSIQLNELINCEITNNMAPGNGGGAYIVGISKLKVEDAQINNNTNYQSGCGIYLYAIQDSVWITGSEFTNNITSNSGLYLYQAGGGIYMFGCDNYHILNSVIKNNSNFEGSAIYSDTGDYSIGILENLLIVDNYQCNHPDTTEFLGTVAMERGQDLNINNCTICNNECDTTVVDFSGISLGSSNQFVDIKESIFWNNSGDEYDDQISENDIHYCDIEDIPFTGNNCFESDPLFSNENNYELHWLSPCIDTGDDSDNDPDGTYPDIGYIYHQQDVYNWEYDENRITWEWRGFPKMMVADSLNTGQYVSPDSVLTNWVPRPDSIQVEFGVSSSWLKGEWNYLLDQWEWTPNNNREISSTMGMKIFRDNPSAKLFFRGGLCETDTELSIVDYTKNWLGYFLKDSQHVSDAIPKAVMDSLLMVQTYRWSMCRNTTDQQWIGSPNYTFNYGDLVILSSVCDTTFCWQESFRSGEPVYRPFAEHYEYEEKSDYIPIYAVLNPLNRPDEIAVFVDGVCKGAEIVDADTTQICAYIMEEEMGQNIEFELWYNGRQNADRYENYIVHDQSTGQKQSANIYTGMPGNYYLVSFEETGDVPPAGIQLNCYPNPFNPELNIAFNLAEETPLEVDIYNIKGQKVRTLADEFYRAGEYDLIWDGRNSKGIQTSSGVYFIRLKAGKDMLYRKAVMLK